MVVQLHNDLIILIRLGIGHKDVSNYTDSVDWQDIKILAVKQGLTAIVADGIEQLPDAKRPPKELLLQWIGLVMQDETRYTIQQKAAAEMALLFHENYVRTYVLKGAIVAECYPKPEHRVSSDMDCFLLHDRSDFDAWALGNDLIKAKGFETDTDFYKNSAFYLPGLTVENHRFLIPFRGNKQLKKLEKLLQGLLREDKGEDRFEGTWLYRPPVMLTALFLIEHAYSHFLHEGLTWRHVLDWMLFSRKHKEEIDWVTLDALIDEFGFRKFYNSYYHLGQYLLGDATEEDLTKLDKRMLDDVWAELDLHETLHGVKGKLALAGNTWRARWKYHYFSEISMPHALWIQVKGFLFDKHPTLD